MRLGDCLRDGQTQSGAAISTAGRVGAIETVEDMGIASGAIPSPESFTERLIPPAHSRVATLTGAARRCMLERVIDQDQQEPAQGGLVC